MVSHQAFEEYKKRGITPKLKEEIFDAFLEIRKANPQRRIIVRRAYVVPGIAEPPGPHSPFLTKPEIAVLAVKEIFGFAIKNKFDKKGAEIAAWLQPVIDDWEYKLVGGCATPSLIKNEVIIEAIYGEDEGVQSCPHDVYIVNFKENIIKNKQIQHKTQYIKYSEEEMNIRKVPKELQDRQVLNDLLILQVASDFGKLSQKFGPYRVEFTCPREEGVFFLECGPFEIKTKPKRVVKMQGEVLRIGEIDDIYQIKENNKIAFIDPKVIVKRDRNLLTSLAVNAPHQMIILYPGTATTAHAATIFRELGHTLVFTPNKVFKTGEKVAIQLEAGELIAKKLKKREILWLNQIKNEDLSLVGGKALNLAKLKNQGFNVPNAFVITTQARGEISPHAKKILENFKKLNSKRVAVRSSATCEDKPGVSFAGQFESYLSVKKDSLLQKVKKCWTSAHNPAALAYARCQGVSPEAIKMAVIVQEMIFAEKGGVIFTRDIAKNDSDHLVIEAARGLGENVVSGIVNPERIVVDKKSGKLIEKETPEGKVLTKKEIQKLAKIGIEIEKLYHSPQDIEWAIMKGKIYILQSRPITG